MGGYANANGLKGGNYKKLNIIFENRLRAQPQAIRERMVKRVEDFIYNLLVNVFNAENSAPLAIEAILTAGSYDPGAKSTRIEDPDEWTEDKIKERAALIVGDKGPAGDFED